MFNVKCISFLKYCRSLAITFSSLFCKRGFIGEKITRLLMLSTNEAISGIFQRNWNIFVRKLILQESTQVVIRRSKVCRGIRRFGIILHSTICSISFTIVRHEAKCWKFTLTCILGYIPVILLSLHGLAARVIVSNDPQ